MSTIVMSACWPLQMPPTPKAVLISLADNANDHGHCWPSLTKISERTCFGRTAVIEAIKWLEEHRAIRADRSNRYSTSYSITPHLFIEVELVRETNQSARRTSPANGELVRLADDEVRQTDDEVRQTDPNRKEPSRTVIKSNRQKASPVSRPEGVSEQTWGDWLILRKAKKATVTETALAGIQREAAKAGVPLEEVLVTCCERGWAGFKASWLQPHERAGPVNGAKPSAAASFRGKTYTGTPIDDIPADLRPT